MKQARIRFDYKCSKTGGIALDFKNNDEDTWSLYVLYYFNDDAYTRHLPIDIITNIQRMIDDGYTFVSTSIS